MGSELADVGLSTGNLDLAGVGDRPSGACVARRGLGPHVLRPRPNCMQTSAPHHSVMVDGAPRCLCAKRLSPAELAHLRLRHRSPVWSGVLLWGLPFPIGLEQGLARWEGPRVCGNVSSQLCKQLVTHRAAMPWPLQALVL